MSARRFLRAVTRPFKRLIRRYFWRHQWIERESPYPVRKCPVCNRVDVLGNDDWGQSWQTMIKGVKSRHYTEESKK